MTSAVATNVPSPPKVFAALDVAWVIVLVSLIFLRWKDVFGLGALGDPAGGVLPLIVPWAGALGGVAISLVGTAKHSRDWDNAWNVWHAIRPFSGAVAGTVSFFIVVVVLRTAGGLTEAATELPLTVTSIGLFFVIAFVTGFRDSVFLNLIADVAKVVFSSGSTPAEPISYSVDASEISFGQVPAGDTSRRTVRVTLTGGESVILQQGWCSVSDAAFGCAELPINVLGAPYRDIEVSFRPPAKGPVQATLKIDIADQQKEVVLTGEGV